MEQDPSQQARTLFDKLRALKKALQTPDGSNKPHNYYTARHAADTAKIIRSWAAEGFKPQQINCAPMGLRPDTVRLRMFYGLLWLADNLDDPKDKEFFRDIKETITMRTDGDTIQLFRSRSPVNFMVPLKTNNVPALQASLLSWFASNPAPNAKWPVTKINWDLTDDEAAWFREQLELHKHEFYIGKAERNFVQFVRYFGELQTEDTP